MNFCVSIKRIRVQMKKFFESAIQMYRTMALFLLIVCDISHNVTIAIVYNVPKCTRGIIETKT